MSASINQREPLLFLLERSRNSGCVVRWVTPAVEQKSGTEECHHITRPTAYRITRFSHWIAPLEGHDVGGLGSTNSGGSLVSSEYSLTRSRATWNELEFPR